MEIRCLGSGSTGNCYLVKIGSNTILLDAGLSIDKISSAVNLNEVEFAFISHEHKDHSLSQEKLILRGVNVLDGARIHQMVKIGYNCRKEGKLNVLMFPVKHGDVNCSAIIIASPETKEILLYATDFNLIEYDLSKIKFTHILIECNYNEEMISNNSEYTRVKENIARHCSMENLHNFYLDRFNLSNCEEIYLCHLSSNFSDEMTIAAKTYSRYKLPLGICQKRGGITWYGKD